MDRGLVTLADRSMSSEGQPRQAFADVTRLMFETAVNELSYNVGHAPTSISCERTKAGDRLVHVDTPTLRHHAPGSIDHDAAIERVLQLALGAVRSTKPFRPSCLA